MFFEEIPANFYIIILVIFYNIRILSIAKQKLKSNYNYLKYYGQNFK
jgi:hypothetical protein